MSTDRKERVTELVNEHGAMVFATAYRILGNAEDAQDALQEVFLKLLGGWRDRLAPDAVRNWGAYLRVATVRTAVDLLHRRRRSGNCVEIPEDVADPSAADPRHAAIGRERAGQLRQAFARLPKREARVFALRYFEDRSYEQIAEETGMRVRRVGVLLFRARGRLRKLLTPFTDSEIHTPSHRLIPETREKEKSHVAG